MTTEPNEQRSDIVLIGAGNLATRLGLALHAHGYPIRQVYSRTEASAARLARLVGATWTTAFDCLRSDAQLYIVALTDKALEAHVADIAACNPSEGIFVHTAGSMPMDCWQGRAARYGVIYPLQTFSRQREVSFAHLPIFLEASDKATLHLLRQVAGSLTDTVREADSGQRRYLHLAAVLACNFTNHLYALAADLLAEHGLAFDHLLPLIDETVAKVHDLPPREAQTGPAVRFDTNVIDRHLALLDGHPDLQALYRQLSESIHRMASHPQTNESES